MMAPNQDFLFIVHFTAGLSQVGIFDDTAPVADLPRVSFDDQVPAALIPISSLFDKNNYRAVPLCALITLLPS
jgi:hypothetical protein